MPLFRGLGTEVITETCKSVMDLKLSRDQIVYQEGRFGTEMYFLVSGEVEVSRDGERLGFLAEGAFFGETSFIESISGRGGDGSGIRTRTIRTVCACDFGVISQKDLRDVVETYPELKVRLQNFKLVGSVFTQKGKRKQEYRELKQQVMRAEGGDDDSPDTEHGFGTLVPPDVDGDDDADDVLNDALLAGIESDGPLPSPPRRQPSVPPTEAVSSDRALAAMQSQVSSLEAEMRAQLQLVRDEMANTRRELLAAINAVGTVAPPDTNGAPVRGVRAEHAKATGEQKAAGWGRREGGIGLGTAATIVAQTTNAARERRRRPSFE
jgi:CRP-like cAMP-binding protein